MNECKFIYSDKKTSTQNLACSQRQVLVLCGVCFFWGEGLGGIGYHKG